MLGAEGLLADSQRALVVRPCPSKVALVPKQDGDHGEGPGRIGMLGPSTFSYIASARSWSGRAPARSPRCLSRLARLLRLFAVSGCSGPSAFSRIASARS